jgi:hypothetical protein
MRVLRTILGMLLLCAGLPALLAGAGLWAAMQHRDAGGAYRAQLQPMATPGYAYVVEDVDDLLRSDAPFARLGSSRLGLAAGTPEGPAFLGLGPADQVSRYLAGVPHSTIRTIDIGTGALPVGTTPVPGVRAPITVPGAASFWTRTGVGQLSWTPGKMSGGPYSLVIMSPGAKPGLQVAAVAELRPSWLNSSAWGLLTLGTLLVLIGLVALAWPVAQREVVYIVEPSQVPALMKAIGAPMPINRSRPAGAHRPRTLADAQKADFPALPPATPSMPWPPPAPAAPAPAASAPAPATPAPAPAASGAAGTAFSAAVRPSAEEYAAATAIPVGAGAPAGERSPAPGEPLSLLAAGPVSAAPGSADPIFGRSGPAGRGEPDLDELPPFQAAAVGAWVAETAPARARETEVQAAERMAEAARLRAAAPGVAAQPATAAGGAGGTGAEWPASSVPSAPSGDEAAAGQVDASGESPRVESGPPQVGAPLSGPAPAAAARAEKSVVGGAVKGDMSPEAEPGDGAPTDASARDVEVARDGLVAEDRLDKPAEVTKAEVAAAVARAKPGRKAPRKEAVSTERASLDESSPEKAAPDKAAPKNVGAAPKNVGPEKAALNETPSDEPVSEESASNQSAHQDEPENPEERPGPPRGGSGRPTSPTGGSPAPAGEPIDAVAAAYAAGAADARAARSTSRPTASRPVAEEQPAGISARQPSASARQAIHPSEQLVSVVTGPRPTDWSAPGLTRADSPRVGRPMSEPMVGERPTAGRPGIDQPMPARPTFEQPRVGQPGSQPPGSLPPGPTSPGSTRPGVMRPGSPRPGPMPGQPGLGVGSAPGSRSAGTTDAQPETVRQAVSGNPGAPAGSGSRGPVSSPGGVRGPATPGTNGSKPGPPGADIRPGRHQAPATGTDAASAGPETTNPANGRHAAGSPQIRPAGSGVGPSSADRGSGPRLHSVVEGSGAVPARGEESRPANGSPVNDAPANGVATDGNPAGGTGINGTAANSSPTNGAAPNGAAPNGAAPNGAAPNGAAPSNAVLNGAVPNSTVPNSATASGATANGATASGAAGDGSSANSLGATVGRTPGGGAPVNGGPAFGGPTNGMANGGHSSVVGESGTARLAGGDEPAATAPAVPRPAPPRPAGPRRPAVPSPARPSGPSQPTRPETGAGGGPPPAASDAPTSDRPSSDDAAPAASNSAQPEVVRPDSGAAHDGATNDNPARDSAAGDLRGAGSSIEETRGADDWADEAAVIGTEVRVDGPRPTRASVIARIQGQGTPSAVAGDWAQAQAEPTQAIHLVIPGHPAATRPVARTEDGSVAVSDGALATGETVAAEPLATAGDLTGPTGHGRGAVVVEFGRPDEPPAAADPTPTEPVLEGRLLAQAQGRVDGTFTPSQTARPNGLGLGRPAPAAWRKAAESVAARAAGLTEPAEETDEPAKVTPVKAARARTTRTAKKAEPDPAAESNTAARTRAAKAAKPEAEAAKPATRRASAKPDASGSAEPRGTRSSTAKSIPGTPTAKSSTAASSARSASSTPAAKSGTSSPAVKPATSAASAKPGTSTPAVKSATSAASAKSAARPGTGAPAAKPALGPARSAARPSKGVAARSTAAGAGATGAASGGAASGGAASGGAASGGAASGGAASGGVRAGGAGDVGAAGNPPTSAADRLSYRTEAAELLAGATAPRRRRTVAELEPTEEKPRRRGAADRG